MNSECPLQKLKWNSFCSLQWRKDKERRIFVILLLKRHLMFVNIFRFWTSNFFTDDGCEHANMKQFTFVAGNIRSQYTLFCKNRWLFIPKLQTRLVTVLNWSFCFEKVSYLYSMTTWSLHELFIFQLLRFTSSKTKLVNNRRDRLGWSVFYP